jgi:hypothetical protein
MDWKEPIYDNHVAHAEQIGDANGVQKNLPTLVCVG